MEKQSAINIVVVSLSDKFTKAVASSLSTKLDMFMVDCHDMIVYDLINPKDVLEKCGIEYFKKREKGVVRNCAEYFDTIISINYELLKEYRELFSKSLVFYIRLPEEKIKQAPNLVAYEHRDAVLSEISKENIIQLDKRSSVQAVEKISIKLGEIYENI